MIYLITGGPGSGKTLSAMAMMERIQKEDPNRVIYAANIDGLTMPGVLPLDDEGVLSWHKTCEKNSVIFVDEAQRYWRAQRSGEPSQAIIEMETHRHDGIDIVLMTQHPTFLHANIRKLVHQHVHLIAFSKQSALRYEWREAHDDVQDNSLRQSGEFKEWSYPKQLYPFYKSATLHTKRAKRPLKMRIARAMLWVLGALFLAGLGTLGWRIFHSGNIVADAKKLDAPGAVSSASSASPRHAAVSMQTPEEYVKAQLPRVASQPYSAPIYDGEKPTQHPRIWCIAGVPPGPCKCITDQGTRYELEDQQCRAVAAGGAPYDPFRRDNRRDERPASSRESASAPAAPVLAAIPAPVTSMASGGVRWPAGVGAQHYTAPAEPGSWDSDPFGGASRGQ